MSRQEKRTRKVSEAQRSGSKSLSESTTSLINHTDVFMASSIGDLKWLKQCLNDDESKATKFDKSGVAAIHLCALHGRLDCMKLLVERYEVDVNLTSSTGWTPLLLSINNQTGRNALKCVEYLLENSADPSSQNDDGTTPAHQSAQEGQLECLRLVIERGGVVNLKDTKGHLPVDLARIWGHKDCGRLLASTEWKHSKDFFAHELHRLMLFKEYQEYLQKVRDHDTHRRKRENCDIAFKQWLDLKGYSLTDLRPHFTETLKHGCNSATKRHSEKETDIKEVNSQSLNESDPGGKSHRGKNTSSSPLPSKGPETQTEEGDEEVKEQRKPKLPEALIAEVIRPSKNPRSLAFKCDTILDVQQKRYGLQSGLSDRQSQVGMLLCDYPDAETIYPGFKKLRHPPSPTNTSSSSSSKSFQSMNTEKRRGCGIVEISSRN